MHGPATILPLKATELSYAVRGRTLVDRLSFSIEPRRRTLVLGPNGAGKSLTLALCHGLLAPTGGGVVWQGPAAASGRKRHAMVLQAPVLLRRTARGNLVHALAVNGWGFRERRERADAALERFGLTPFAYRSARALSGGERQRLALARAWALKPEVLFLDEPTAALDPCATRTIETLIEGCAAEGVTVVMSTHDLGQARRLADDVLFLHHGRLVEQAPASDFFAGPKTAEASAFLEGSLLW